MVHYPEINALVEKYQQYGLVVLGFPCNNFGLQEPGADASEILNGLKFVRPGNGFEPKFRLTQKIDVNGDKEHPIYTYLKRNCESPKDMFYNSTDLFYSPLRSRDIRWNFESFLISKDGYPIYRYSDDTLPLNLKSTIEALLKL
ncbi:hypothetical protein CHS0354_032075 [Potamilus streckersoni]|uniref:Glutathione peroxidase n=1 Tax=Potamilus streckersoni TaxID=2493646 RepID=A0AAE0TLI7_9BIVA|nr:hypothetical protein CHS0354_032075 [Potamilus streckersoni]